MKQGSVSQLPLRWLDRTGELPALVNPNDGILPGNADLIERIDDCAHAVGIERDCLTQPFLA